MGRVNFKNSQDRLTGWDCYEIFWTHATVAIGNWLCAPRSRGKTVRKKQAVVDNFSGTWNCRRAPQRTWVKFPCFIWRHMLTLRTVWMHHAAILFSSRNKSFIDWNRLGLLPLRGKDVQLIEVNDKCEFCYFVNVISKIVISPSFSIICCRSKYILTLWVRNFGFLVFQRVNNLSKSKVRDMWDSVWHCVTLRVTCYLISVNGAGESSI